MIIVLKIEVQRNWQCELIPDLVKIVKRHLLKVQRLAVFYNLSTVSCLAGGVQKKPISQPRSLSFFFFFTCIQVCFQKSFTNINVVFLLLEQRGSGLDSALYYTHL